MKDWEAKKSAMRQAINAVQDLHTFDPEMHWCACCEVYWPCPTLVAIQEHVDLQILNPCPYTHSHTKSWCGYPLCRES